MGCLFHNWIRTSLNEYNIDVGACCKDCSAVRDTNGRVFFMDDEGKKGSGEKKKFLVGAALVIFGIPFIG